MSLSSFHRWVGNKPRAPQKTFDRSIFILFLRQRLLGRIPRVSSAMSPTIKVAYGELHDSDRSLRQPVSVIAEKSRQGSSPVGPKTSYFADLHRRERHRRLFRRRRSRARRSRSARVTDESCSPVRVRFGSQVMSFIVLDVQSMACVLRKRGLGMYHEYSIFTQDE